MVHLSTAQPARQTEPTVKAQSLAYLVFQRSDLPAAEKFLCDFGLRVARRDPEALYFRGTGTAPFCYVVHAAVEDRFVRYGLCRGQPCRPAQAGCPARRLCNKTLHGTRWWRSGSA